MIIDKKIIPVLKQDSGAWLPLVFSMTSSKACASTQQVGVSQVSFLFPVRRIKIKKVIVAGWVYNSVTGFTQPRDNNFIYALLDPIGGFIKSAQGVVYGDDGVTLIHKIILNEGVNDFEIIIDVTTATASDVFELTWYGILGQAFANCFLNVNLTFYAEYQ